MTNKKRKSKSWNTRLRRAHRAMRNRVDIDWDSYSRKLTTQQQQAVVRYTAHLGVSDTGPEKKINIQKINTKISQLMKELK